MAQATIVKGKDLKECGSYRPISLLCCDKIFTKVFAHRLDTEIPKIIDSDQTGFKPGRQSVLNNILHSYSNVSDYKHIVFPQKRSFPYQSVGNSVRSQPCSSFPNIRIYLPGSTTSTLMSRSF